MRQYFAAGMLLLVLAVVESSFLPAVLGGSLRPNLVLVVVSVWAAIRGSEGYVWAFMGGLFLDLTSSLPVGLYSFSLLIGNVAATIVDRAPIPSPAIRAATWVAMVTVVSNGLILAGLAITGVQFDILYAMTNVILPLLIINPALAIPTYVVLNRVNLRLKSQEK